MNILTQNSPSAAAITYQRVALALGSNSSNAGEIFLQAVELLAAGGFTTRKLSKSIVTKPVECPPGTPDFTNAALIGSYTGTPEELLELTQSTEEKLGRPRNHAFHAARSCDIDIIIMDDLILNTPELVIPHPRAQERFFVLQPLAEIAPDWLFCNTAKSVSTALEELAATNK